MHCYHCGYEINESKLEKKKSSYSLDTPISDTAKVAYVCPRCGHLIHADGTEEEVKSLSRASHAQLQRARNDFSFGMGDIAIAIILLIIAIIFFMLAKKPSNQNQLVVTCAEFYVFCVLLAISVILLTLGVVYVYLGLTKKHHYTVLLQDINNKTFVQ
jgi:DNA-directed RNA polymerase subunit RPC12/RpoP